MACGHEGINRKSPPLRFSTPKGLQPSALILCLQCASIFAAVPGLDNLTLEIVGCDPSLTQLITDLGKSRIPKRIPFLGRWRLRLRRQMILQPEHRFV